MANNASLMVSVVIPSYGNFAGLLRCLDSVQSSTRMPHGSFEEVVVTSGYTDEEVESLRFRGSRVTQLDRPAPTSLSRNIGAESCTAKFLLFLDDDNVVAPDAIFLLSEALSRWDDAVVVGPAMYYGTAPDRLWCAGVRRSRVLMKTTFRTQLPDPTPERMSSDDFPNCFMVRRKEFETINGFDALRFPQQWEEGDLARRLAGRFGGAAFVVPQSRIWHYIELPLVRRLHLRNGDRAFLVARGRAMFTALHGDSLQWLAYLVAAQWMFGAFYLSTTLSLPRSQRTSVLVGYLKGMRAGLVHGWRARAENRRIARTSGAHIRTYR